MADVCRSKNCIEHQIGLSLQALSDLLGGLACNGSTSLCAHIFRFISTFDCVRGFVHLHLIFFMSCNDSEGGEGNEKSSSGSYTLNVGSV